jgi:predicted transposase/invertase (TIGR01784 family)
MYDDTCRFLAEHFSADFASWLLGEPFTMTELKPSELSLDPIRADAMILLQSEDSILHIEFQTLPEKNIPFRMADYRLRGYRCYEDKSMRQVVIYLKPTTSELVYQTSFTLENTRHDFEVMRCGCGSSLLHYFCNILDCCLLQHWGRVKAQQRCCDKPLKLSIR